MEEGIISVKLEDEKSEKLRNESLKEELNYVKNGSDNGVIVENMVTVKYEAEKSEKLRNEMQEVKPRCKEVAVHNDICDLLPNIEYYDLWTKIIKADRIKDLKYFFQK